MLRNGIWHRGQCAEGVRTSEVVTVNPAVNLLVVTVLTVAALVLLSLLLLLDRRHRRGEPLSRHRQALRSLRGIRRAEGLDPFPTLDHRLRVYRRDQMKR